MDFWAKEGLSTLVHNPAIQHPSRIFCLCNKLASTKVIPVESILLKRSAADLEDCQRGLRFLGCLIFNLNEELSGLDISNKGTLKLMNFQAIVP